MLKDFVHGRDFRVSPNFGFLNVCRKSRLKINTKWRVLFALVSIVLLGERLSNLLEHRLLEDVHLISRFDSKLKEMEVLMNESLSVMTNIPVANIESISSHQSSGPFITLFQTTHKPTFTGNRTENEELRTDKNISAEHLIQNNNDTGNNTAETNQSWIPENYSSQYLVPNVVHFIWFTHREAPKDLLFINYVSILSAHQVQKPESIVLHYNIHLPRGKWWMQLLKTVPIKTRRRSVPTSIFGKPIYKIYHQADFAKFQTILRYGGIYLDGDVFVINSLNPLRKYAATMGKESPPKLIAGIVIGARGAEFYRLVIEGYRDYQSNKWDYNCAEVPYRIALSRPELIHVENRSLTTPDWLERKLLWRELIEWRHLYVVHAMAHWDHPEQFTPESVARLNTTFGEIVRHIYYGSSELIYTIDDI